jgi:hypothetical protein
MKEGEPTHEQNHTTRARRGGGNRRPGGRVLGSGLVRTTTSTAGLVHSTTTSGSTRDCGPRRHAAG